MGPKTFVPPANHAELVERIEKEGITLAGANSVRGTLIDRRNDTVKKLDAEIRFYDHVIEYHKSKMSDA